MSGEKSIQQFQKSLPCKEISYCDKKIQQLSPNIKHSKYGFDNNQLTLTYREKTERGVISLNGKILQRLKISKQQFLDITSQIKNSSSIANLEYNKEFSLKSPLYITVDENNIFTFYKIQYFNQRKSSEIDEAEYNSDMDRKRYSGEGAIGFSIGLIVGGSFVTFLVFSSVIKKFLFN
jgi:hypothetical protein